MITLSGMLESKFLMENGMTEVNNQKIASELVSLAERIAAQPEYRWGKVKRIHLPRVVGN